MTGKFHGVPIDLETLISVGWELVHLMNLASYPGDGVEVRILHNGSSQVTVSVVFKREHDIQSLIEFTTGANPENDALAEAVDFVRQRISAMSQIPGIVTGEVMGS